MRRMHSVRNNPMLRTMGMRAISVRIRGQGINFQAISTAADLPRARAAPHLSTPTAHRGRTAVLLILNKIFTAR